MPTLPCNAICSTSQAATRQTTEISPSICQEWVRFSTVASYIGPSRPACSQAIRLFRSVDAPSAPIPQRQTMMLEIVAAAPVTVNMMLLKTTCPIISTSTASIALSPLVNSAEISRPMQLDENIVSKTVIKISISVSSSRWFCGTCTMETKPKARIAACKTSTSSSTAALLSTTAGRLTPTDASRRMISRSLQISR